MVSFGIGRAAAAAAVLMAFILHVVDRYSLRSALVVVDVQPCFMPGGSLPVPQGSEVVPVVTELVTSGLPWSLVAFTQEIHPPGHVSFASSFGRQPLEVVTLSYSESGLLCDHEDKIANGTTTCGPGEALHTFEQTLWPEHCVQGSLEAELHPGLPYDSAKHTLIKKGYNQHIDGYSAIFDNGRFNATPLVQALAHARINRVYVAGLAYDYCVAWTAVDASSLGYEVAVMRDATRGIAEGSEQAATEHMQRQGVRVISVKDARAELLTANCIIGDELERWLGVKLPCRLRAACQALELAWAHARGAVQSRLSRPL